MATYVIRDGAGQNWVYDKDRIYGILRAAERARLIRARTRKVSERPSVLLPTTYHMETNWVGLRVAVAAGAEQLWGDSIREMRRDASHVFDNLVALVDEASSNNNWFREQMVICSRDSNRNIGSAVRQWEGAVRNAQLLRDASATVIVVTAGIAAAPAGAAAMGTLGVSSVTTGTAIQTLALGSIMRGAFTYQDTGNVGAAAISAGGTFTVGLVGVAGAGVSGIAGSSAQVMILSSGLAGTMAGGQALVEGNSLTQAAVAAAISAGGQAAGSAVGSGLESCSAFVQISSGAAIDTAASLASGAAVQAAGQVPANIPSTSGGIDFMGIPISSSEDYVRQFALCPI